MKARTFLAVVAAGDRRVQILDLADPAHQHRLGLSRIQNS